MFHAAEQFTFTAGLEAAWRDVRREFDALVADDFIDWYQPDAYSGAWRVCGIHAPGHPEAQRISDEVVRRCPVTLNLVRSVPGVHFGAFSVLGPRAIIHPHADRDKKVLRCHLGLVTPRGCRFRVGDEEVAWEEGRCLVFDGSTMHAAWNHSDSPRAVLLVEFERDGGA